MVSSLFRLRQSVECILQGRNLVLFLSLFRRRNRVAFTIRP